MFMKTLTEKEEGTVCGKFLILTSMIMSCKIAENYM